MAKINFLRSKKTRGIFSKDYWHNSLTSEAALFIKRLFYILSWPAITLISTVVFLRIFLSSQIVWLQEIDIIPFLFILVDFIIINRIYSRQGLKKDKFWFWFLVSLLFLNFIWSFGLNKFVQQEIYDFKIGLNYFLIVIGFLLLVLSKKRTVELLNSISRIKSELQGSRKKERLQEEERVKKYTKEYKAIYRLPVLKSVGKWVSQQGGWATFLVIILLASFLIIKIPYLDNTIIESGSNFDKFRSYLPNLINAYTHHNIFLNQNFYYINLDSFKGGSSIYTDFPFYTWVFYPFMPLAEKISFLLLVRVLMALLDVLILLGIYLFFSKIFTKKIALIGLLFLVVNTFFHNFFFVTVMGRPALLFLFFAIVSYLNNKKPRAYLLSGLALLVRISFMPILLVFLIPMILIDNKGIKYKFSGLINFVILTFLPIVLFHQLIRYIPLYTYSVGLLIILFSIIVIVIAYYVVKKNIIQSWIFRYKYSWLFVALFFYLFSSVIYKKVISLSNDFLPDFSFVYRWEVYYLILKQLELFFPTNIWILSLLGFLVVITLYNKKNRKIFLIFTASVLAYLIIGSKVIFFHHYYRHLFVIWLVFLTISFLSIIPYVTKRKILNYTVFIFIVSLFTLSSYNIYGGTAKRLGSKDNFKNYTQAVDFLRQEVKPDEKTIITKGEIRVGLLLLTYRSPANFSRLISDEVSESGFCETMEKYNVKYYISEGESDFSDILYLFETPVVTENIDRTEHILYRISNEFRKKYPDSQLEDLRKEIETVEYSLDLEILHDQYRPDQYFELDKVIGNFYIYRLKDCRLIDYKEPDVF